ncbi:hypothetical protein V502_11449 [Pseudogymnoascus sp. VKM F-4520 (FW-2644)]|nr:hypothetical protein V502_11449 [Pseudogymnoascus sp. VKM F-4520 (FW-2644)]
MDPENCHRSLHEHRRAIKERYRRLVRDQMKSEDASWEYQRQQGLEPFPYDAFEMKQPLLPALNRAIHESGGDGVRAWQTFDRRSGREKAAEVAVSEEREAEVHRRADEMIRNDKETKEDEAMRELLEGLPTFKFPHISIADRIFYHLSADFKKHNYLRQLRNTQARLRKLRQLNSELRVENERLKSGVVILDSQVEHNLPQRLNSEVEIFNNQVENNRRRGPLFEPLVQRHYSHPPQPQRLRSQQPQINWVHQRSTAPPLKGLDMTVGHQANTIAQNGGISQMNHMMEYSPMEIEGIHHGRRNSMPPHNRARTRAGDFHTPLPELNTVTGYGTVVAADEIGPIYDYTNLDGVSMRGGAGPYSLLEDSDAEGDDNSDGKATNLSNVTSSLGKGTRNGIKRFIDDDEDDDSISSHSGLKFTRHGDTRSNDPNNQLWGSGPPSSSGIGRSATTVNNPAGHRNRNDRHQGRRRRNRAATIAPGLVPFTPKVDPYAEVPHGFQFTRNQAENVPLKKTWSTLDPKTGTVKYEEGAQEAQEENPQETYMWNPSDARNTPLAATLGYSDVVYAAEVKEKKVPEARSLTAKSLQRLEKQSRRDRTESIDDYIDITSTPGSPNAPPSEPSVVEFHSASAQGGIATGNTVAEQGSHIDADVRKNFIDSISAMHDARLAPTLFEQQNQGWIAQNKAPVSYINEFSADNVVEVKMKTEMRTRMMNERGEYDGKDQGQVKKRHLRGFFEMIQSRDDEMVRASKEYREWQAMSLEDRMERLTLIRQPIDLWKGKPGADQDDQHDLKFLPKFYERRVSRRKEKQRMRAILADKAKQKKKDDASTSLGTTGTGDTLDTFGVLGDCDDLPVRGTSGGSQTPVGNESLQEMLRRVVDVGPSRDSKSRSRSSSKTASAAGSKGAEPGFRRPERVYANPRSRPRPSLRNAHLGGHIFNSSGTEQSSDGTNAANEHAALIAAYDDSPTLRIPADTDIPSAPLTDGEVNLHSYAIGNMEERGRVVTVRLHAVQEAHGAPGDVLPKFTPGAIANKVFGGVVQEFQLHPGKRTAVVVFVHPREARSFVHHVRNVREKGTEHDIRDLQIEASFFRGVESQAILPAQPNLLKHSITASRRCILLSHIPKEKSLRTVSQELSNSFGTILVRTSLITPEQNYILLSEGKQALIEFANLQDAIRAYDDLNAGLIAGYENANPQYRNEPSEKRVVAKDYCGCLGCDEKRDKKAREKEAKERKRNEQMGEDEYDLSSYSDTASE